MAEEILTFTLRYGNSLTQGTGPDDDLAPASTGAAADTRCGQQAGTAERGQSCEEERALLRADALTCASVGLG